MTFVINRRTIAALLFASLLTLDAPLRAAATEEKHITVAPDVILRAIESANRAGGPPIIFIPGWGAGGDIWRDQIERFDDKYRVISFDPRSQGESSKTVSGNTPEQRAADLHTLIAKLKVERPVLVGWSQAAQDIAAYVATYGTHDLSGIVLVDAAVSDGAKGIAAHPEQAAFQFSLLGVYLSDQQAYLRGMFEAIISKPQAPGVVDQAVATAMKTPPSVGISMLVADVFTIDRTPSLAKMDCPVLIIAAGNSDEIGQQKAQANAIKNARFVQIDDAAHAVFLDQPDRFAAVLTEFLNSLQQR